MSFLNTQTVAITVQMLHEAVPTADTIALLSDPANPVLTEIETREAETAARVLGVRLLILNANHLGEIETAFAKLVGQKVDGPHAGAPKARPSETVCR